MNNNIDQLSGATHHYGVKINGQLCPGYYSTEGEAHTHGIRFCNEGDTMEVVLVTSSSQEILLG